MRRPRRRRRGRHARRSSRVERLDGEPVIGSGHEEALLAAGFSRGVKKLTASA